jgi:hypothetical protein
MAHTEPGEVLLVGTVHWVTLLFGKHGVFHGLCSSQTSGAASGAGSSDISGVLHIIYLIYLVRSGLLRA